MQSRKRKLALICGVESRLLTLATVSSHEPQTVIRYSPGSF